MSQSAGRSQGLSQFRKIGLILLGLAVGLLLGARWDSASGREQRWLCGAMGGGSTIQTEGFSNT
jgi:hypothetical protein